MSRMIRYLLLFLSPEGFTCHTYGSTLRGSHEPAHRHSHAAVILRGDYGRFRVLCASKRNAVCVACRDAEFRLYRECHQLRQFSIGPLLYLYPFTDPVQFNTCTDSAATCSTSTQCIRERNHLFSFQILTEISHIRGESFTILRFFITFNTKKNGR